MNKNIVNVLIADDHQLLLDGMKNTIESDPGFKVVAQANDGEEVLIKLKSYYVDIVILDIQMPKLNGIDTARIIKEKYAYIKVVAFSMHNEKVFIEKMYNAGAAGYILKTAGKEEVIGAIKTVTRGGTYFSPDIISAMFDKSVNSAMNSMNTELTRRELEILTFIAKEFSNPQIADQLYLSPQTINTHRKNILRKVGVKNTAGLVKYAMSLNLVH